MNNIDIIAVSIIGIGALFFVFNKLISFVGVLFRKLVSFSFFIAMAAWLVSTVGGDTSQFKPVLDSVGVSQIVSTVNTIVLKITGSVFSTIIKTFVTGNA